MEENIDIVLGCLPYFLLAKFSGCAADKRVKNHKHSRQ